MGELGQTLLQTLGASGGGIPGAAPSPVGVVPPEGYADPGMKMFGIQNLPTGGGISETGAIPRQTPMPVPPELAQEVDAVVQGFKPKKISFWGALGDQLLKHWGNEPAFAKKIQHRNLSKAMEGFTQDPMEAIRRMSKIPGMEQKAWELMNTLQDNQRADQAQGRLMGKDRESVINRSLGLLRTIKEDGSNYDAVKQVWDGIMQRNGISDAPLPTDFDPEVIGAQAATGMTMNQHAMDEYRRANLARQNRNTDSQIERREDQTRQGDVKIGQTERRLDQADTAEEGRNKRYNTPKPKAGKAGVAQTVLPDGSMITYGGSDKATALTAIVTGKDGTKHYLRKLPTGKWAVVAAPTKEK